MNCLLTFLLSAESASAGRMLAAGHCSVGKGGAYTVYVVQPSCSPYGLPMLFVKKCTGGPRMCIDFRRLNEETAKNIYPLTCIDAFFDQLQGATKSSSIDFAECIQTGQAAARRCA